MFIKDHGGAGPQHEHIGFGLGHILCKNSLVFFSSRRAPAGMLCLVEGLVLQGRDSLVHRIV